MVNYACIFVLWLSLGSCLGQSAEEVLKQQFQGTSPECQESLVTCALPLVLPYVKASDPHEALDIARSIRLGEHCRKTRKSFTCFRSLIGKDQCSDLDPKMVKIWQVAIEPILDDVWTYICRAEFKKFSIHYACLLTEELSDDTARNCSSVSSESEAGDCLGRVVKEHCGATASRITKTLFEVIAKHIKDAQKEIDKERARDENRTDDDDEQDQQTTLPEDVYDRSLSVWKKILKRK